jgi:uncharacterized protein
MRIPHTALSPATLRAVIEEFITREGTDYGERELTLDEKVDVVMLQLRQKQAFIVYDEETESCTLTR